MATPTIDDLYEVCSCSYKGVQISVVRGDICNVQANVIVNSADESLQGGDGTGLDGRIHIAAGPRLLAYLTQLPLTYTGNRGIMGLAYSSPPFNMADRVGAIVHAVGPDYRICSQIESQKGLELVYTNALKSAAQANMGNDLTIVLPSISTGAFSFPPATAAITAVDSILEFVKQYSGVGEFKFASKFERIVIMMYVDPDMGIDSDPMEQHYIDAFGDSPGGNDDLVVTFNPNN